jgi:predicted outer membrane protein
VGACGELAEVDDGTGETRKTWTVQKREDTTTSPVRGVATFSPDQALGVATLLTRTALEQARLGEARATSMEVKTYAAAMLAAHASTLAALEDLGRGRSVPDDPTLDILLVEGSRSLGDLGKIPKEEIELPFMTAEMTLHARALALLDASLLPSAATDPAVVHALMEVRTQTADHLVHALRVQGVVRAALQPAAR